MPSVDVRVAILISLILSGCEKGEAETRDSAPSAPSAPVSAGGVPVPSAAPSVAVPIPEALAAAPPKPEEVTAVIVWQKDEKAAGGFRSQWVERIDQKPKVTGERPGIVAISSTSLWTLGSTIVRGCSQLAHDKDGQVVVQNDMPVRERPDMKMPELVRTTDGLRVAPWKDGHGYPIVGTQCESTLEEYSARISFEGGMGTFVVAALHSYQFDGGAHGLRGETFFAIDLEKGAGVKLEPPSADIVALEVKAAAELHVERKEISRSGVVPVYGPLGAGLALYRFTAPATYAEGTGGNSYTNDFVISSKSLPSALEPYRTLPAWIVPHLQGKSLTVLVVPPARMASMKTQFDAAYAASDKEAGGSKR